jgi:hypothetical protein
MSPLSYILSRQLNWAARNRKNVDRYYVETVTDNLFQPLAAETIEEFNRADGNELRSIRGSRAKMLALRSSSALAVNVFHYWRTHDLKLIAQACRIPRAGIQSLQFERLTPIAENINRKVFPRDPNIDVVLGYRGTTGLREVGIESKFAEAYGSHKGIKPAYLDHQELWSDIPHCREFAEATRHPGTNFGVDYAQLLKHILGLKHRNNGVRHFILLYIWYAVPHPEIALHNEQLRNFQGLLKRDGIDFRFITYQELIQRLSISAGPGHAPYMSYLIERYL